VEWRALESGALTACAYEPREQALYLRFVSGEVYRYLFFLPGQYEAFLAAESKGKYFAQHIRDKFPWEHLSRDAA
jgi:hypothetical protein